MIIIDRNFVRAFAPDEQLVMLRLLLEADNEGVVSYDAHKMEKWTKLSEGALMNVCRKLLSDGIISGENGKLVIKDFDGYVYQGKKATKKREVVKYTEPIEVRMKNFYNSLIPFVDSRGGQYPKEMIRKFYDWWSEPNKSNTKMKFELQKTWEVSRRLATWASRDKTFNSNNNYQSRDDQRTNDIQRRQEAAAGIIARLAAEENDDAQ